MRGVYKKGLADAGLRRGKWLYAGGIVGGIHRHYPAHCGGGLSVTKGPPTGWCSASALRDIEKHHHRKPTHNPRVAVVSHRYELQMVMVGQQELARVMDLGQCWASRSNRRWKS